MYDGLVSCGFPGERVAERDIPGVSAREARSGDVGQGTPAGGAAPDGGQSGAGTQVGTKGVPKHITCRC